MVALTKIIRFNLSRRDLKLVVSPIPSLAPLQLTVISYQSLRLLVCRSKGALESTRRHRCARKFHADGAFTRDLVVRHVVEPNEVRDPICVRVTGEEDGVGDVVGVEVV